MVTGVMNVCRIIAMCGDYYIGGRRFSSLSDLIGYYSYVSCLLKGEKLISPVAPPEVDILYYLLTEKLTMSFPLYIKNYMFCYVSLLKTAGGCGQFSHTPKCPKLMRSGKFILFMLLSNTVYY